MKRKYRIQKQKPKSKSKNKIKQKLAKLVSYLISTNMIQTEKIANVMRKVDRGEFCP